jgi:hypothetical protein
MTVRCIDGGVSMSRRRRRLVCRPKRSAVHRGPARSRRPRLSTPLAGGALHLSNPIRGWHRAAS